MACFAAGRRGREVRRVDGNPYYRPYRSAGRIARARVRDTGPDCGEHGEPISQSSAFWSATNAGNAELNLPGWQFEYRIHHRDRRILVVGAWQLGDHQVG